MIIKINTADGNIYRITNKNIISSKYQADCSDDNEIILGFASASSFNFSIKNLDNIYKNVNFIDSKIELWDDTETIKKGTFNLNKITKRKNIISFETIDDMIKFDQKFKGATFPLSILDLINVICNQCNVQVGNTINSSLVNCQTILSTSDNFIGKNCREILQLLCEIVGRYAIIDENGKLQLRWFDFNTIKKEIKYSELYDFEREDLNSQIDGIEVYIDNEKYSYSTGGNYSLYLTENNPFFLDSDSSSINILLKNIYESNLKDMNYYAFNLKTRIDYNINIGDVIKVEDEDGLFYLGIITNIELDNDSGMTITSSGENRDRDYNSTSGGGGGSSENEQKVQITENTNFRKISVLKGKYQTTNSFNIENVSSKSQVFINYLCEFTCSTQNYLLDFEFYINDNKIRTIQTQGDSYIGQFNAGFKLVLDEEQSINTLMINCKSQLGNIDILPMKSVVTLVASGCSPDSAGNTSEIRLSDNITKFNYSTINNISSSFFIIKSFEEAYNLILKDENINNLTEKVDLLDLSNILSDFTVDDININIT